MLLSILVVDDVMAQRSRTRSRTRDRTEREDDSFNQWYTISLGTLGFGAGFSISGKYSYGFRFQDRISVGAYGKALYQLVNQFQAPDIGLFDYGAGGFTRINITEDIFLQGEYSYSSFEQVDRNDRRNILYPSVGGGYKSGFNDWTYGFHILVPINEEARDFINVEYWIDFNYKF